MPNSLRGTVIYPVTRAIEQVPSQLYTTGASSNSTDAEFLSAIEYARRCIGRENLALKPQQLETVWQVCHGRDVFLWLPTGFGKTLCYELLPFVIDYRRGKHSRRVIRNLSRILSPSTLALRKPDYFTEILRNTSRMREQIIPPSPTKTAWERG